MNIQFIVLGQLILAAALGGVIGFERETHHKEAGVRTHALVAFGSALFTLIALHALVQFTSPTMIIDPSRIMSEVVTGIGFIGAGVIIFRNERVRGLTTAAGLWVCAAIGMAVATQWYMVAIFGTAFIALLLHVIGPLFTASESDAVARKTKSTK
ncbi:MAG: MgtC/SapB family protein [Candidatus Kerfeldbacteria bacterium]|nr:MgtC/SapB family protein [Candidatus Kerfeldbacteria bacterium]